MAKPTVSDIMHHLDKQSKVGMKLTGPRGASTYRSARRNAAKKLRKFFK